MVAAAAGCGSKKNETRVVLCPVAPAAQGTGVGESGQGGGRGRGKVVASPAGCGMVCLRRKVRQISARSRHHGGRAGVRNRTPSHQVLSRVRAPPCAPHAHAREKVPSVVGIHHPHSGSANSAGWVVRRRRRQKAYAIRRRVTGARRRRRIRDSCGARHSRLSYAGSQPSPGVPCRIWTSSRPRVDTDRLVAPAWQAAGRALPHVAHRIDTI